MSLSRFTRICLALCGIMLCVVSAVGGKKTTPDQVRAKARHFYLKGAVMQSEGKYDQAYEYYKKAYQIDPTYADAGYAYGMHRVLISNDTFTTPQEMKKSLGYMRALLDANPKDVNIHETYAVYAVQGDTLPEALRVYKNLVKQHPGLSRLYPAQAFIFMKQNEADSAIHALNEYERLEGSSSETVMRKVSYYVAKGDTAGAIQEVKRFVETNPNSSEPLMNLAIVYDLLEQPDSAFLVMKETVERFPEDGDLQFDMALLCLQKGDTIGFHNYVYAAVQEDNIDEEEILEMLKQYMEKLPKGASSYKESDRVFDYVRKLYPNEMEFMHVFENYEYFKGNYERAYELSKKTFAIDPSDYFLLGRMLNFGLMANKPKEVMEAFENFDGIDELNAYSLNLMYISAAEALKEYDKALTAAGSLLQYTDGDLTLSDTLTAESPKLADLDSYDKSTAAIVYEIAGEINARKGDREAAKRNYENALVLLPDNPSTLNNYAYYLVETEKVKPGTPEFTRAKEMSYKALEQTQDDPQFTYYDTYAWVLFKENNYKDAMAFQELAIQLAGSDVQGEMLSHYGDMLFMSGQPEMALEYWKKAYELDPDDKLLKKKIEHKTFFYE